jgi:hypothetical protein
MIKCVFGSALDIIDSNRIDSDKIDSDRIDFERIDLYLDTIDSNLASVPKTIEVVINIDPQGLC